MKIPYLDMLQFKEPLNQLKYISPYAFIIEPNICVLKNGALAEDWDKRSCFLFWVGNIIL